VSEIVQFTGFAGIRLEAEVDGSPDDPAVLLVHGGGQTRGVWGNVATALVQAGRRVVTLDLRGHGGSEWPADGRYDFDAYVQDMRAVLAQLGTRPVVVAATLGGWIATAALAGDAAMLAAGLVLVDLPTHADDAALRAFGDAVRGAGQDDALPAWDLRIRDRFDGRAMPDRLSDVAPGIAIPVLIVRGALSALVTHDAAAAFAGEFADAEFGEVADADLLIVTDRTEAFNGLLLDFLERRLPRDTPEYRSGSDARTLRDALGCFATGVTIVTAIGPDGLPIGLTANSFTSVSLDPPLLLVCIANNANSAAVLRDATHFAINVLQIGQQPTSNRFASKALDRFAATPWTPGVTGAPVLTGSLSAFECARHAIHEGGDHFLLIGHVVRASFEPRRDPLLYFRGKYRRLHFA